MWFTGFSVFTVVQPSLPCNYRTPLRPERKPHTPCFPTPAPGNHCQFSVAGLAASGPCTCGLRSPLGFLHSVPCPPARPRGGVCQCPSSFQGRMMATGVNGPPFAYPLIREDICGVSTIRLLWIILLCTLTYRFKWAFVSFLLGVYLGVDLWDSATSWGTWGTSRLSSKVHQFIFPPAVYGVSNFSCAHQNFYCIFIIAIIAAVMRLLCPDLHVPDDWWRRASLHGVGLLCVIFGEISGSLSIFRLGYLFFIWIMYIEYLPPRPSQDL